ncbi:MAG TPA: sulfur carrier protein ThiS [Candidatus Tumulicola sp.]
MKTTVNGEVRELAAGSTLASLLVELGAPVNGIAVAKNECVVRRADYASHVLSDGDRIEIIKAVAGG